MYVPSSWCEDRIVGTNLPPKHWRDIALTLAKEHDKLKEEHSKLKGYAAIQQKSVSALERQLAEAKLEKKDNTLLITLQSLQNELAETRKERDMLVAERRVQDGVIRKLSFQLRHSCDPESSTRLEKDKSLDYYKQLSTRHLTESSDLAEQLICLRTDMERQNQELLRCKKGGTSYMTETSAQLLTLTQDEMPPQPETEEPRPILLASASPFRETGWRKDETARSAASFKLDPPRLPYNFVYRPHNGVTAKKTGEDVR